MVKVAGVWIGSGGRVLWNHDGVCCVPSVDVVVDKEAVGNWVIR